MNFFTGPDLDALFDPSLWGTTAIINGAFEINGILDEQYTDPLGLSAVTPAFTCAAADYANPLPGDVVDIATRRWTVSAVEPDGTGVVVLRLKVVN